jgi:hypothetical protein
MITGIKIAMTGEELSDIFRKRANTWTRRADGLRLRKKTTATVGEEAEERAMRFEDKASDLMFVAEHIIRSETYLLSLCDLTESGIIESILG